MCLKCRIEKLERTVAAASTPGDVLTLVVSAAGMRITLEMRDHHIEHRPMIVMPAGLGTSPTATTGKLQSMNLSRFHPQGSSLELKIILTPVSVSPRK